MDRREAILRELNLYPLWVRRNRPASKAGNPLSVEADMELTPPVIAEVPMLLAVRPEPVEGPVSSVNVVRQAHHERPNEQAGKNSNSVTLPVVTPATPVDNLDWPELKQRVRDCTACKLRAGCTQTVFGVGDENADWLFVGEGPGADEDALGEPFVGQAGKLLDNMLMAIKLKRGNNVYIANVVKCRPPGNRAPAADEVAQCLPYLQRQIELIRPKVIVALGKTAATALLMKPLAIRPGESTTPAKSLVMGRDVTLGSLRGTLHDYRGIPLIVTYHPAYLLRTPSEKAKAWQDLCLAVRVLDGTAMKERS